MTMDLFWKRSVGYPDEEENQKIIGYIGLEIKTEIFAVYIETVHNSLSQ